ncbi:MAG: hypothetical protein ACK5HU_02600 [Flavobacteriales bacterium]
MRFQQQLLSKLWILALLIVSCSSSDDKLEPCLEVDNIGSMTVKGNDLKNYSYNNLTYSYMDREGVNANGNFVYEFIYSNYDIDATQVKEGYFLKFRIITPDHIPDGTFTLTDSIKTISHVETFYDFTPGESLGKIDVTNMSVTFSNFDDCLNHEIKVYFLDDEYPPGIEGNGVFVGKSNLYTIE